MGDIGKSKLRPPVNHGAIGNYAIGLCCLAVQIELVNCVGFESQCALDGKRTVFTSTLARRQNRAATAFVSDSYVTADYAPAAESAGVDLHGAAAGAGAVLVVDHKFAAVNCGASGIGVPVIENKDTRPDFGQRAAPAAAVVNDAGELRASVVAAYEEGVASKKHIPVTFNRADRYARCEVIADVQVAVAENLHTRRATTGPRSQLSRTTRASAQATVIDEGAIARGRAVQERCLAAPRVTDRGGAVRENPIASGRGAVEFRAAGVCAADRGAVVCEGAIACGRAVKERCLAGGRAVDRGGAVRENPMASGRGRYKLGEAGGFPNGCGAFVGKSSQAPGRRAVSEEYRYKETVIGLMSSHKVLLDPRMVLDAHTADV